MDYIVKTPSATKLKKEIIDSVTDKVDANGRGIATWQCVEIDGNEKVLVHTKDQWAEKGCIAIKHDISHNELHVRFHYWESCTDKDVDDNKYMLGRFTELLLVHFSYFIDKIVIE